MVVAGRTDGQASSSEPHTSVTATIQLALRQTLTSRKPYLSNFHSKRSRLPRFQLNSTQRSKGAGAFLSGFTEHPLAKFVH